MVKIMKFTDIAQEGNAKMVSCTCNDSVLSVRRSSIL